MSTACRMHFNYYQTIIYVSLSLNLHFHPSPLHSTLNIFWAVFPRFHFSYLWKSQRKQKKKKKIRRWFMSRVKHCTRHNYINNDEIFENLKKHFASEKRKKRCVFSVFYCFWVQNVRNCSGKYFYGQTLMGNETMKYQKHLQSKQTN